MICPVYLLITSTSCLMLCFCWKEKKKKRLYNSSLDQNNKVIQPCISLFYTREHQMAAFSRCHKDALYNVWEQFQITFMAWVAAQYQRRLSSFFRCLIPEPSFQIQPEWFELALDPSWFLGHLLLSVSDDTFCFRVSCLFFFWKDWEMHTYSW